MRTSGRSWRDTPRLAGAQQLEVQQHLTHGQLRALLRRPPELPRQQEAGARQRRPHGVIHVTRLHYLGVVNPREGVITGMTNDGTFRIRDGKVA